MPCAEVEDTLAQVCDQHRKMMEQHALLMTQVASSSWQALKAENARLEKELAVLRDCVRRHSVSTKSYMTPLHSLEDATASPRPNLPGMVDQKAWDCAPQLTEIARRVSSDEVLAAWDDDVKQESRERRRLRAMFGLDASAGDEVPLDKAAEVLSGRVAQSMGPTWVLGALRAVEDARATLEQAKPEFEVSWLTDTGFSIDGFVELVSPDAKLLMGEVPPVAQDDVFELIAALRMATVDEVIDEAARGGTTPSPLVQVLKRGGKYSMDSIVNGVVVSTVLLNIFAMGVSIDIDPEHYGWVLFETSCVAVFIGEAVFKITTYGMRHYLFGPAGFWNAMDAIVTFLSILDVGVSIWSLASGPMTESKLAGLGRVIVMLRTSRVVRIVRLAKLLHAPLLRDLANMLVGFAIGVPALIWVLALFCFVLYVVALIFRLVLGPGTGQDLIFGQGCGWPDESTDYNHPICKIHWMYGEEFFGSVPSSMFTVFRFMLGDYSTRGGKSMIIALSYGYGMMFELVFVTFMIIVIFGLFNIITAIFVDSTTSGLKHNEIKRKYAQQYEREYVKNKLRCLLERVCALHMEKRLVGDPHLEDAHDYAAFGLGEDEFVQIMGDPIVKDIAKGLDVDINNPAGLFGTFDANHDGSVSMLEMAQVLLRLRGEPHKTDVIECVVSIRHLQDRFDTIAVRLKHVCEALHDAGAAGLSPSCASPTWSSDVKRKRSQRGSQKPLWS